jgi:6-phosphogluconolactonase (cycloisomerase 2 family)
MRTFETKWSLILAILVALLAPIATARAQSELNLVYMESNIGSIPDSNSIYAFSNTGGVLTPLSGSPFLTGGTGVYDPPDSNREFGADQQVAILSAGANANNLYLLAVNGDSNTIASFAINSKGALTPVTGSPFASNGSDPVSLAVASNLFTLTTGNPPTTSMYSWVGVVNKNADPNQCGTCSDAIPNFNTFLMNSHGKLSAVPDSTVTLPVDSGPSQMLVAPGTHWAYLDELQGSTAGVYAYKILQNTTDPLASGKTAPINSAGPPVSGALVFNMSVNPVAPYIYAFMASIGEVAVYTYQGTSGTTPGAISLVTTVPNPGMAGCWGAVNSTGTYLYVADFDSGTIVVYSLANPALPVLVQQFALTNTKGVKLPNPGNLAFDPTEAYLYCLDNPHSILHVMAVNSSTGELTEPNAPTVLPSPSGEQALGLATLMIK